jgi:hypothetical protein
VRTVAIIGACVGLVASACVSAPNNGPLGEGFNLHPAITSVDTAKPPHFAWVELDQQNYVALLLVQPGRGVTLLYPRDSALDNRLSAGAHQITFALISGRATLDSLNRLRRRTPGRGDTLRTMAEQRTASSMSAQLPLDNFLLLFSSPEQISYARIHDKLTGVSIPTDDMEALNAVSKAVKSTLPTEPREWGAYYRLIDVTPPR